MMSPLTRSVLLVEDEAGLRLALRTHFLRHGWSTTVASGVREATTALKLQRFDLIVSDMRMLDGDGFEVLAQAKTLAPGTAVLFLTASASVAEAVQAVRQGAVDYLVKPLSSDLLMTHAQRVVNERMMQVINVPVAEVRVMPISSARSDDELGTCDPASLLSMSDVERAHLTQTLERVGGNRTRAAEVLGISVRSLRNKVRQYDLPPRRYA